MRDKGEVGANLYVEDSPENVEELRRLNKDVLIFSNPTNRDVSDDPGGRARNWLEAERKIREFYYKWLEEKKLSLPPDIGMEPDWAKNSPRPTV